MGEETFLLHSPLRGFLPYVLARMARRVREDTYLTRDEADDLQEAADQLDMSKSEFLREGMNEKIDRMDREVTADD